MKTKVPLLTHFTATAGICILALSFGGPTQAATATVNSGQSIQVALDAVGNAGGGTVYLESGNYSVPTSQNVPNNVHMWGQGSTRPVLTLNNGANIQVITNKSVPFTTVTVDFIAVNGGLTTSNMLAGTYNNTLGIDLSDHFNTVTNTNGIIINCSATNCSMGYNMGRNLGGNGGQLNDCSVTNCGGAPIGSTPGLHNIYISTCNPMLVTSVTTTHCLTGEGLKLCDFNGNDNVNQNTVQYVTSNNNQGQVGTHNGCGIAIYNEVNPIVNHCTSTNNNGDGIFIEDNDGTHPCTVENSTFTGNYYQVNDSYDMYIINVVPTPVVTNCTYNTSNIY